MTTTPITSVMVVGCGYPGRSMGHYHCYQIIEQPLHSQMKLTYVVEPWYMDRAPKSSPGADEFDAWRKDKEEHHGVQFFASVRDVPPIQDGERRLAIVSARTADNPKLVMECFGEGITHGPRCHVIYLEKPGAPTVSELVTLRDAALQANVKVYMGFNKNVAKYSTQTMAQLAKHDDDGHVTFVHNNNYTKDQLGECFERNSEGMLKNMAIHELALVVSFFGVSTDSIDTVEADQEYSSCQTLLGPSGHYFTDFDKLKFTITTKDGVKVSIAADRCGGDDSVGILTDSSGNELCRYSMPDEDDLIRMKVLESQNPGANTYFYVQDPDYAKLKERIARTCWDDTPPEGVATIDVAIETLRVAEYLTPLLQEQLLYTNNSVAHD